jgi:hypothetical protein
MDFVILKVNGKDVSNSSHEEAVEVFLAAEEPIMVEVMRRGENLTTDMIDSFIDDKESSRSTQLSPEGSPHQSFKKSEILNSWPKNSSESNENSSSHIIDVKHNDVCLPYLNFHVSERTKAKIQIITSSYNVLYFILSISKSQ